MGLLLANNDRDNNTSSQFDWLDLIESGSYARPNLWGELELGDLVPIGTDVPPAAPLNLRAVN